MLANEESTKDSMNTKVFVRILPLLKRCEDCMKISPDKKTIFLRCLQTIKQKKNPLYWSFKTDGVFYDSSQKEIYQETTYDIINKVLDGVNCVVISCGQTGTGKSFTMGGLRNNWEHRGLVPRLLAELLAVKARKRQTNKINYSLSYVEFRGRKVSDLLNPNYRKSVDGNNRSGLFKNITRVTIKDEKDGLQHIFKGESRRAVVESSVYPVCHLGTAVITFHVCNTSLITSWAVITEASIHIVEMAGIDTTQGNTRCYKKARDVIAANTMKLEMEQFFVNQHGTRTTTSPYARSNNLLKYLEDPLSRASLIRFIAHIRVTKEDLDVAMSTLRLAAKIAQFHPLKLSYKVKSRETINVDKLYEEIARLKRELDVNEMFFAQEAVMNVSKSRAQQIEQDFYRYLNGTISDVKLLSLSQAQVLMKMIKDLYAKITKEEEEAQESVEKSETELINNVINGSKTSVQGFAKDTRQRSIYSKDRVPISSVEIADENNILGVGVLDSAGITLGPGLTKIPVNSALMRTLKVVKTSGGQSREQCEQGDALELRRAESQPKMRKAFEAMQKMLTRLMEIQLQSSKNEI